MQIGIAHARERDCQKLMLIALFVYSEFKKRWISERKSFHHH